MRTLTVKKLLSEFAKSRGLIGVKKIYPVYFTTRWGIHTFGVVHPIDVLILNKDYRVAAIAHSLPPNRFWLWNPVHYHVVELPEGTIEKEGIIPGTEIQLTFI